MNEGKGVTLVTWWSAQDIEAVRALQKPFEWLVIAAFHAEAGEGDIQARASVLAVFAHEETADLFIDSAQKQAMLVPAVIGVYTIHRDEFLGEMMRELGKFDRTNEQASELASEVLAKASKR